MVKESAFMFYFLYQEKGCLFIMQIPYIKAIGK